MNIFTQYSARIFQATLFASILLLLLQCAPRAIVAPVLPVAHTILLSDTLLAGRASQFKGIKGHLRPESRIKGAVYDGGDQPFTIGLVDVNGDGRFTDPNEDWILLTVKGNRKVRINSEHGTPHCPFRLPIVLEVDTVQYILSDVQYDGSSLKIKQLASNELASASGIRRLRLNTRVPLTVLKTYAKGDLDLKTVFGKGKFVYIYFWVSRPLEYQVQMLDDLYKNDSSRLSIVGIHIKDHDWEAEANAGNFFAMLAKPWPQASCDPDFYTWLHQDYSWYQGVLADAEGRILFPHISPKELRDLLEK